MINEKTTCSKIIPKCSYSLSTTNLGMVVPETIFIIFIQIFIPIKVSFRKEQIKN